VGEVVEEDGGEFGDEGEDGLEGEGYCIAGFGEATAGTGTGTAAGVAAATAATAMGWWCRCC